MKPNSNNNLIINNKNMSAKEKIKKLENLVNQAFTKDLKIHVIFRDTKTNIYQCQNELNETEYFKSKEDFIKKRGLPENANIIVIEIV